ncbi:MAG: DUF3552 domain-containing protein, partial [Myxococcales bacterium]|nr:DUF3552 domain-containing protein [Myxococcales bacterium]
MTYVLYLVCLLVGGVAGYLAGAAKAGQQSRELQDRAEAEASRIREDAARDAEQKRAAAESDARTRADAITRKAELEADEIRLKAERDADREQKSRRAEIERTEQRLTAREEKLDERASALDRKQNELAEEEKRVARDKQSFEDRNRNLKEREATVDTRLTEIAGLTREDARTQVIASIVDEARLYGAKAARQVEEQALEEAEKRAKKVLAVTIQRYAGEYVTERTVSVVNLPNDEMKGRIIGREGRNIRALETATGCDFIIDDTPEAIIISAFDPVRREVARLSLERLMADGRIHPARIEELVDKTRIEVDKLTKESG